MERGDVDEEQEWGYGGALRGPDFNWCPCAVGALEDQCAVAFRKEGGDPVHHVREEVLSEEERPEFGGVDVVEAIFDVKKQGGNSPPRALEGADFID